MPLEKMIREQTEKDLDEFLRIRIDSLRLCPKAFGADPDTKIDREKTRLDLQSKYKRRKRIPLFLIIKAVKK